MKDSCYNDITDPRTLRGKAKSLPRKLSDRSSFWPMFLALAYTSLNIHVNRQAHTQKHIGMYKSEETRQCFSGEMRRTNVNVKIVAHSCPFRLVRLGDVGTGSNSCRHQRALHLMCIPFIYTYISLLLRASTSLRENNVENDVEA